MASWFYKNGKGEIFEDDICPDGYTDSPAGRVDPPQVEEKKTKRKYVKKVKPETKEVTE